MKDAYSFHLDEASLQRRLPRDVRRLHAHLHALRARVPRGAGRHRRDRRRRLAGVPGARRLRRGRDRVLRRATTTPPTSRRPRRCRPTEPRPAPARAAAARSPTPGASTIEDLARFLKVEPSRCRQDAARRRHGRRRWSRSCVRGDHELNEVKAQKLPGRGEPAAHGERRSASRAPPAPSRATSARSDCKCRVVRRSQRARAGRLRLRRQREGHAPHRRQLGPRPAGARPPPTSATSSRAIRAPRGKGTLKIARGIEVGHVFQLGTQVQRRR